MESKAGHGPLAGIRVIDLTSIVFGPYATQIMADMGADVVKVEPPAGDDARYISVGPAHGLAGVFVNVNRGKRSVVLDLRSEEGKAVLRDLIATADVFIHSMRAKAIAKLGFDYAAVAAINPRIVYTNCYGYGREGPERDQPAYDDTIQGECGLAAVQQMLTGEASYVGTIVADKVAGLTALYSTMMALFHRERTGEGQEVEVGMFETMASFMLVEHANGAMFTPKLGPAVYPRVVAPGRRPYKTKDGHIAALVYNDRHWTAFVEAVKPAWAGPDMATLAQRAKQIDRMYGVLGETFLERTTQEWLDLLRAIGVPAAPLRSPDELFDNAHLDAVGFFETVDSPQGPIRFPGVPATFSRTPAAWRALLRCWVQIPMRCWPSLKREQAEMGELNGKVAVVTGASRGIGKGIALALAEAGATVYVTGRTVGEGSHALPGTVGETASQCAARGGTGIAVQVDHADDDQVAALFERVAREQGRLDILVNNAFAIPEDLTDPGGFWEKPLSNWDMVDVGVKSNFVAAWHAAKIMTPQRSGLIVAISGYVGRTYTYGTVFGTCKAAVDRMARDMAVELQPYGVTSISLWQGLTFTERANRNIENNPAMKASIVTNPLVGCSPEFPGRVIAALAADARATRQSGGTFITAELAREYGVTDIDGKVIPSLREQRGAPIWGPIAETTA